MQVHTVAIVTVTITRHCCQPVCKCKIPPEYKRHMLSIQLTSFDSNIKIKIIYMYVTYSNINCQKLFSLPLI